MSTCRDAALAYAAQGWAVFPLLPNKKTPATPHGLKDATTNPVTIHTLFTNPCNVGIATGHGLVVIDLDVKPGRDGIETWKDLCASHPPLDTFECLTPSGGRHLYFQTTHTIANSASKLGLGIDVRGDGGYVVAPPSTLDGKAYCWESSNPTQPPALSDWLLALLVTPSKKPSAVKSGVILPGQQDDELHKLACSLVRQGLHVETVKAGLRTALLACPQDPAHPFTEQDIERWITGAQRLIEETPSDTAPWVAFHVSMTGKSQPICNADSALHILEQHPLFEASIWFDTFRNAVMTTWEHPHSTEWQEWDMQRLLVFLQRDIRLAKMTKSAVEDALGVFVSTRKRHEVQDWLKTLEWDQTPRIETCLTTMFGAPDTVYVRAASRNFWLSVMARLQRPGCQMDHMLILEGPQNLGKTKALRVLGGERWYLSMTAAVTDKDFFQLLQGKIFVEMAEMESFKGFEVMNRIKQVISTPVDFYRMSYARRAASYPRQCVFVGTTNETDYLRDMTGARRFWPVSCTTIDIPAIEIAREQLFAEAAALFRPGVTWWEMPEEMKEEQEARREEDAWEAPIHEFLLLKDHVTVKDVLCDGVSVPIGQINRLDALRAVAILRKLGWQKKRVRFGDKLFWKWSAPAREPGEDLQVKDFEA